MGQNFKKLCRYICRSITEIQSHCMKTRGWANSIGRGNSRIVRRLRQSGSLNRPWVEGISYQRFFPARSKLSYFSVYTLNSSSHATVDQRIPQSSDAISPPCPELWNQVQDQLDEQEQIASTTIRSTYQYQDLSNNQYSIQLTPWLEVTHWINFLRSQNLRFVVHLTLLSISDSSDYTLTAILQAFDRIIEEGREFVRQDRISVFDQHRINSFIRNRSYHRPILIKLKKATYRYYQTVWKRLICYIYRFITLRQEPQLHFVITDQQSITLNWMMTTVATMEETEREYASARVAKFQQRLDHQYLGFDISLLDHRLRGNIYDNIAVRFLAALKIDKESQRFRESENYISYLSTFIKIT